MCCSDFSIGITFGDRFKDPKLFCPLLVWINVKWITTIFLLQQKLHKQFLLTMETNCFDMVYLIVLCMPTF